MAVSIAQLVRLGCSPGKRGKLGMVQTASQAAIVFIKLIYHPCSQAPVECNNRETQPGSGLIGKLDNLRPTSFPFPGEAELSSRCIPRQNLGASTKNIFPPDFVLENFSGFATL